LSPRRAPEESSYDHQHAAGGIQKHAARRAHDGTDSHDTDGKKRQEAMLLAPQQQISAETQGYKPRNKKKIL
jgi:hypothetical protein